jgi:hypothetical protein
MKRRGSVVIDEEAHGHPYANAQYRVFTLEDRPFGVDVTAAGVLPTKVTGFASQEAADQWVANHKETVKTQRSPISRVHYHRTSRKAPG